ncbi:MAG TPA: TRAM domain-containing protein [Nitrososphaerales archaeon]|nr:TRAM domain-containing protein [Nitrososphaerales archaeon]
MSFGRSGGYGNRGGGGFGRGSGSFNKPVEVGKEYNVTISDTSRRGEGIAKIDGFVIFVPGTKLGQSLRIKVTQVSERFASGQVIQSSEAAAASTPESTAKPTN